MTQEHIPTQPPSNGNPTRFKKKLVKETKGKTDKKVYQLKDIFKFKLELSFLFIFLVISASVFVGVFEEKPTLSYNEFMEKAEDGKVDYITLTRYSDTITVVLKNKKEYTTINLGYDGFMKDIAKAGVDDIRTKTSSALGAFGSIFTTLLSLIVFYVIIKYITSTMGQIGKLTDTNSIENKSTTTFKEIAGMTEEKAELMSAITSLKSAELLKAKGVRPIKGVLLEGPPGVGKTLIAKAIAGEAGVNFLSYSGAGFNEMFMGVGNMKVKAMYKRAVELKPCVVFIDEIDSIGAKRTTRTDGASRESNNTLTSLLERMDGIGSEDGILFIGATNRVDALDDAILRPGRFDKIIHIGPPKTKEDREAIVQVHLNNKTLKQGVTLEQVAKLCYGLSGAQIEGVLNEAVLESIKLGQDGDIDLPHVDEAVMKIFARGVAKGTHTGKDLERVAIHEMGHALMNQFLDRKVVKVSVKPYSSGVGGITQVDEETIGSSSIRPRSELINDIKVLYAGMIAEQVALGEISTGNSNDLERATQLLHGMVSAWGMYDGSLLSQNYFAKSNQPSYDDALVKEQMETLASQIKQEVVEFFTHPEVKELLISTSKQLEKEEVFYELSDNSLLYNSIRNEKYLLTV